VVSSTGSVTCIVLTCSELCETCLSTTRCLKCREVDPNNSQIGLLQTFDGECVRCTA
jgi:cysteine-rich repeat protein